MTFPTTPYIGQKWLDGGRVWQWNGAAWQAANNPIFWEEIAGKPTYMSGSTIVSTSAPANPIPGLQWLNPTADRLFIWNGTAWIEPNTNIIPTGDPDIWNYVQQVESVDGQALETGVIGAYGNFITGLKADGLWDAVKASCILAGARTLNGALIPLAGAAPTNFNFTPADYDRKTGLLGNGTSKYLSSNRNNNSDPQDNFHMSVWRGSVGAKTDTKYYMSAGGGITGSSNISQTNGTFEFRCRTSGTNTSAGLFNNLGFYGINRAESAGYNKRHNNNTQFVTNLSETPYNLTIWIFLRNPSAGALDERIAFYSIGESVDLTKLDARVTALMSELNAAIV